MPNKENHANEISTVNIEHYIHADPLHKSDNNNCRDVRYKFDRTAEYLWDQAEKNRDPIDSETISYLKDAGITDASKLPEHEYLEIRELLTDEVKYYWNYLAKQRSITGKERTRLFFKILLKSGLPGLQEKLEPEHEIIAKHVNTDKKTNDMKYIVFNREEIEKLLLKLSQNLNDKRVREQFTRDMNKILDFIELAKEEQRPLIIEDIKQRILNESLVINNDIKAEQIIGYLKRKFPNVEKTEPESDSIIED